MAIRKGEVTTRAMVGAMLIAATLRDIRDAVASLRT
jgi:hypothetical protein